MGYKRACWMENAVLIKCVFLHFSVVVWNLETREALCGSPAATQSLGPTNCICFANCRDDLFMTGGKYECTISCSYM